jgi:aminopeptidase N
VSIGQRMKAPTKSAHAHNAEPRTRAAAPNLTAQHRLPTTVVPIAYRLSIEPNLNDFTYSGAVEIDINVRKSTNEVVHNAVDLRILDASLDGTPTKTSLDALMERLTVVAAKSLAKGSATLALRFAGVINDKLLDQLIAMYKKSELPETKVSLLRASGAFRSDEPLERAVDYTLNSGNVRSQDGLYVFIGAPIETRPVAWRLFKENWTTINERYGKSVIMAKLIPATAGGIPTEAHADDVERFFRIHPAPSATRAISQTLETIRVLAKFRSRNANELKSNPIGRSGLAHAF